MDVCLHQRRRREVTAPWNGDESGSSRDRLPSRGSIFKISQIVERLTLVLKAGGLSGPFIFQI